VDVMGDFEAPALEVGDWEDLSGAERDDVL